MFSPTLCARVKQRDQLTGFRINGLDSIAFEAIAPGAGQPQVGFIRSAAACQGNDMINMHLRAADALLRLAITAAMMGGYCDFAPQRTGDMRHRCLVFSQQWTPTPQAEQRVSARFTQSNPAILAA